ncbi:DUF6304 family protein [Rhizosphaericola mali]|uniref:Uncharacterized protein n=1 Tax=Rhizosphaericola mali TaxID=2545455 RepID=A0A5P2G751_9BACT|nr:DUF6304 family protein [Rhizosphaericola mali]QES90099.1 hypothetical protein E0W69_016055 [Rhizosphaericola mali]
MKNSVEYKGTYTDHLGIIEIVIHSDYTYLHTEIGGVQFSGREFSDLTISDESSYTNEQLERFTFLNTNGENSLCDCAFSITIPQILFTPKDHSEFTITLELKYTLGNVREDRRGGLKLETADLSTDIKGVHYQATADYMEDALNDIQRQFNAKFYFKNCFNCSFGDYSVFGNSGFGDMRCFVSQKQKFLEVQNKNDFIELENDAVRVQEIYCCDKFESKGCVSL